MTIDKFRKIIIQFQTDMLPPPYSHFYQFVIEPQEASLNLQYQLTYTERETLTEDEIEEEGFTLDDDYAWEGTLPQAWQQALLNILQQTHRLQPKLEKEHPNIVYLQLLVSEDEMQEGIPENIEAWEYFLQELTQAVFETSQRELPLQITYLEVRSPKDILSVVLKPSFSQRELVLEVTENAKKDQKKVAWRQLKPLLKAIYLPDYDEEKASARRPVRPGKYIDPGEGSWYELGKSVSNPGKQYDAIEALEKEIKKLL